MVRTLQKEELWPQLTALYRPGKPVNSHDSQHQTKTCCSVSPQDGNTEPYSTFRSTAVQRRCNKAWEPQLSDRIYWRPTWCFLFQLLLDSHCWSPEGAAGYRQVRWLKLSNVWWVHRPLADRLILLSDLYHYEIFDVVLNWTYCWQNRFHSIIPTEHTVRWTF